MDLGPKSLAPSSVGRIVSSSFWIALVTILLLLAVTDAAPRKSGKFSVFSLFNLKGKSKFWSESVIRGEFDSLEASVSSDSGKAAMFNYTKAGNIASYLKLSEVESIYIPVPVNFIFIGFEGKGNHDFKLSPEELERWFTKIDHIFEHTRIPPVGEVLTPFYKISIDKVQHHHLPLVSHINYNFSVHAIHMGEQVTSVIEYAIKVLSRKEDFLDPRDDSEVLWQVDLERMEYVFSTLIEQLQIANAYNIFILNPRHNGKKRHYGYRRGLSEFEINFLKELPGRTDNEIKNYWNTRIKRCQRTGTPLYPPNVIFQASDDNQQSETATMYSDYGVEQPSELFHGNGFGASAVTFDEFNGNHGALSYVPPFQDVPSNYIIGQGFGSENYCLANPAVDCLKQIRGSEMLIPNYHNGTSSVFPSSEQFSVEPSPKVEQISGLDYPYNPNQNCQTPTPFEGAVFGSHAVTDGNLNFSASRPPLGTVKLELPSIQCLDSDGSQWLAQASAPFEAPDVTIEAPPTFSFQPECVMPSNSGLLDALVIEYSAKNSSPSVVIPNDMVESSGLDLREIELEGYKDPDSPLGISAATLFNECIPPVIGSSLYQFPPLRQHAETNLATTEHVSTQNVVGKDMPHNQYFSSHDS